MHWRKKYAELKWPGLTKQIKATDVDTAPASAAAPKADPEPIERNFCTRCGKRLVAGDVHTCTPPLMGSEHA
jgi:hypothetical protein